MSFEGLKDKVMTIFEVIMAKWQQRGSNGMCPKQISKPTIIGLRELKTLLSLVNYDQQGSNQLVNGHRPRGLVLT